MVKVLILPVSGGGFPVQLSSVCKLISVDYRPEISFASSGGNVAIYITSASRWDPFKIKNICSTLDQSMFISNWNNVELISYGIGFYTKSIYNYGNGARTFFETYFDSKSVMNDEIWTGTYNDNMKRAGLFCNRTKESSILYSNVDIGLIQSLPFTYSCGDIGLISKYSIASASIPSLVPPQYINGDPYVDGGVASASPLTFLQENLYNTVHARDQNLHMIYLNSFDLNSYIDKEPCYNLVDKWRIATKDIIRSKTTVDRLSAYNLLKIGGNKVKSKEFRCTRRNLLKYIKLTKFYKSSLLEIYPSTSREIDITKFNGAEIVKMINECDTDLYCRLWYSGNL